MMTNWFNQTQTKLTHIKPLTIALSALLSLSVVTFAQAETIDTSASQTTTDPNAFDESTFRLDLAEYLGAKGMQEFSDLSPNNKVLFQNDFTSILRKLWMKTTLDGEAVDTLVVVQPFIQAFVSTLRSLDYAGTEPQQKFQTLMKERNLLFAAGVFLPTDVEESLSNLEESTNLTAKTIEICDVNGSQAIEWLKERNCAWKVILQDAKMKSIELDQSIAEGQRELAEGIERGKQLDQRIANLTDDIRNNLE